MQSRGKMQGYNASHYPQTVGNGRPTAPDGSSHFIGAAPLAVQRPYLPTDLHYGCGCDGFSGGMGSIPLQTGQGQFTTAQPPRLGQQPLGVQSGARGPNISGHINPNFYPQAAVMPSLSHPGHSPMVPQTNGHRIRGGSDVPEAHLSPQTWQLIDQNPSQSPMGTIYGPQRSRGFTGSHQGPRSRGRGRESQISGHRGRGGRQAMEGRAAPAVPSFGLSLPAPIQSPRSQSTADEPRSKKRKYNQLGLTPSTEIRESSEEQEDVDDNEEGKLASTVPQRSTTLQVCYKGETSTLLSASDIAAWIEERKKKWPTKARAAERKAKQREEAQAAIEKARKERKQRQDTLMKQKQQNSKSRKRQKHGENPTTDESHANIEAAKSKRKIEKLQRQLQKEQERVARAEAKLLASEKQSRSAEIAKEGQMRIRSDSPHHAKELPSVEITVLDPHQHVTSVSEVADKDPMRLESVACPLTPVSPPAHPEKSCDLQRAGSGEAQIATNPGLSNQEGHQQENQIDVPKTSDANVSDGNISDSSSTISYTLTDDLTSSSGSSDTESDDEDAIPDVATSRRPQPEKTLPPERAKSTRICKNFLKGGRCRFGKKCNFKHELPSRGNRDAKPKHEAQAEVSKPRISLHQRVSPALRLGCVVRS